VKGMQPHLLDIARQQHEGLHRPVFTAVHSRLRNRT
jgi:hypothetical protein